MGCLGCCATKEEPCRSASRSSKRQKGRHPQKSHGLGQAHQPPPATASTEDRSQDLPTGSSGRHTAGQAGSGENSVSKVQRQQRPEIIGAAQATRLGTAGIEGRSQLLPPGSVGLQAASPATALTEPHPQLLPRNPAKSQTIRPRSGGVDSASRGTTQHPVTEAPPVGKDIEQRLPESRDAKTSESRSETRHQSAAASSSQVQSARSLLRKTVHTNTVREDPKPTGKTHQQSTRKLSADEVKDNRKQPSNAAGGESSKSRQEKQQPPPGASALQVQPHGSAVLQIRSPPNTGQVSGSSKESSTSSGESFTLVLSGTMLYSDCLAVDADGAQFKPEPHGDARLLPRSHPPQWVRRRNGKLGIGIETEFLLEAYDAAHKARTKVDFAENLQTNHNACVDVVHPLLRNETVFPDPDPKYQGDEWTLVNDDTVKTDKEPWAIEMTSPIFIAQPGSHWRSHVEATWDFLKRHYEVIEHMDYGTHIHVSVEGGYTLQELKRIAQCVIHFEPAFDALVPSHRSGGNNLFAKSNWIDGKYFAKCNRSRSQSIQFIDTIDNLGTLITVMNPEGDKRYAWNFESIRTYWTVEFRKPPVCTEVEQVLSWTELAMSFIQSSIRCRCQEKLLQVPSTIGGLRWFLQQSYVPTMNQHVRLETFWRDRGRKYRNKNNFVPAGGPLGFYSKDERSKLEKLIETDTRRIQTHAQAAREPYWH